MLAQLARPDVGLGALMDDVDVVKVAHHGSTGAWSDEAWARHAATRRPVAIIAPYAPSRLPTADVLGRLRAAACRLGITSAEGDGAGRARRAGWADAAARSVPLVERGVREGHAAARRRRRDARVRRRLARLIARSRVRAVAPHARISRYYRRRR